MQRSLSSCPVALPKLIAREAAVAAIATRLTEARLLTITGPGGIGKTVLAQHVAQRVTTETHLAAYVDLSDLSDGSLVVPTLLAALEADRSFTQDALTRVIQHLESQRSLLILENCEHVIGECARVVHLLLQHCPQLIILATSREALALAEEVLWPVPPLDVPEPDRACSVNEAATFSAVQLFLARAAAVNPRFTLTEHNVQAIIHICRQVGGIPLALELAAARTKMLGVHEIAQRLDEGLHVLRSAKRDTLPRQATMTATIEWSFHLLSATEQRVLCGLAICAADFALGFVHALGYELGLGHDEVEEIFARLVDKSLVATVPAEESVRFALLIPIRVYCREQLAHTDDDAWAFHAYGTWVESLCAPIAMGMMLPTLQRQQLEHEQPHLRAMLDWRSQHDVAGFHRLAYKLFPYWLQCSHFQEGARWSALDRDIACRLSPHALAQAELACGAVALTQCEHAQAQAHFTRATQWFQTHPDAIEFAVCLRYQGILHNRQGDYPAAEAALRQAINWFAQADMPEQLAHTWHQLGVTAQAASQDDLARDAYEQALDLYRAQHDDLAQAATLHDLGCLAAKHENLSEAEWYLTQGQQLFHAAGDDLGEAYAYSNLADIAIRRHQWERIPDLLIHAAALVTEHGDKIILFCLFDNAATWLCHQGMHEQAARFWGKANQMPADYGMVMLEKSATEQEDYDEALAYLQRAMGEAAFLRTWKAGAHAALAPLLSELRDCLQPHIAAPNVLRVANAPEAVQPILRLAGFGAARVFLGQHELTPSDWVYSKARELVFYLLHHEPSSKDRIALALWPEATADYVQRMFRNVLYHARHALGDNDWIVLEGKRYHFNRALPYSYDLETFLQTINQARQTESPSPALLDQLAEATHLYREEVLGGCDAAEWALQVRREMRQAQLDALLMLGHAAEQERRLDAAQDYFSRACHLEPLCEVAHRGVIRCLLEQHAYSRARQQFLHLQQVLRDELNVAPEPQTVALLQQRLGQ